ALAPYDCHRHERREHIRDKNARATALTEQWNGIDHAEFEADLKLITVFLLCPIPTTALQKAQFTLVDEGTRRSSCAQVLGDELSPISKVARIVPTEPLCPGRRYRLVLTGLPDGRRVDSQFSNYLIAATAQESENDPVPTDPCPQRPLA